MDQTEEEQLATALQASLEDVPVARPPPPPYNPAAYGTGNTPPPYDPAALSSAFMPPPPPPPPPPSAAPSGPQTSPAQQSTSVPADFSSISAPVRPRNHSVPESEQTKGFLTNLKERVFGAQGELDDTPEHTQCTEGLALAPPTWEPNNGRTGTALCLICASSFGMLKRKHHCRNCGRLVCASCSEKRWLPNMLPPEFNKNSERSLRVCDMCYSATEGFRKALLAGDSQEAIQIFSGCRIRCLSTPYAIYEGSLYPVHCAAKAGSLELLMWLVEEHDCSLQVVTGRGNTALAVACGALSQAEITPEQSTHLLELIRWLVCERGCAIHSELRDLRSVQDALHGLLLLSSGNPSSPTIPSAAAAPVWLPADDESRECIVCFESVAELVVLVPCGHVAVCTSCAAELQSAGQSCPVCRTDIREVVKPFSV